MPWDERCPMGGPHDLIEPRLWSGLSCRQCHKTWTTTNMVPTYKVAS